MEIDTNANDIFWAAFIEPELAKETPSFLTLEEIARKMTRMDDQTDDQRCIHRCVLGEGETTYLHVHPQKQITYRATGMGIIHVIELDKDGEHIWTHDVGSGGVEKVVVEAGIPHMLCAFELSTVMIHSAGDDISEVVWEEAALLEKVG